MTSIISEPKVSGLAALTAEWREQNPSTPDEVQAFYRTSTALEHDLRDHHETNETRQRWTQAIVTLAKREGLTRVLDIGCGRGDDLAALREAGITNPTTTLGIEPNETLAGIAYHRALVPIADGIHRLKDDETFDLTLLMDVLEHLVEPAAYLDRVIAHMNVGSWLVEHSPTWDIKNPTHLKENWGWSPAHQLRRNGFQLREQEGGFRIWQRIGEKAAPSQTLILVSYRAVAPETVGKISQLHHLGTWNVLPQTNDALVSRARSMAVSRWWRDDPGDVFLMVDSDITFDPADAMKIVQRCRDGHPVIAGAYAIRDGTSIASRITPGESVTFAPDAEPVEISYAATGFLAVRRDVIDKLVTMAPLCHADQMWSFWNLFPTPVVDLPNGDKELMSEDWGFCRLVREAGFKVHLDPSIRLDHLGMYAYRLEDVVEKRQRSRIPRITIQEKAREWE